jgi:hypothetical protein
MLPFFGTWFGVVHCEIVRQLRRAQQRSSRSLPGIPGHTDRGTQVACSQAYRLCALVMQWGLRDCPKVYHKHCIA